MPYILIDRFHPIKVLLAEDDIDDQFLFADTLSQTPFSTDLTIVKNGSDLLEKLQDKNSIPHVMFLDLNMPKVNGKECLKVIRANKQLETIPCIILSTSSLPNDIIETYDLGANLFLVKPTRSRTFEKIFESVFQLDWQNYFPLKKSYIFSMRIISISYNSQSPKKSFLYPYWPFIAHIINPL